MHGVRLSTIFYNFLIIIILRYLCVLILHFLPSFPPLSFSFPFLFYVFHPSSLFVPPHLLSSQSFRLSLSSCILSSRALLSFFLSRIVYKAFFLLSSSICLLFIHFLVKILQLSLVSAPCFSPANILASFPFSIFCTLRYRLILLISFPPPLLCFFIIPPPLSSLPSASHHPLIFNYSLTCF